MPTSRGRWAAIWILGWSVWYAFGVSTWLLQLHLNGPPAQASEYGGVALRFLLNYTLPGALLSPLIVLAAIRFPLMPWRAGNLLAHLFLALVYLVSWGAVATVLDFVWLPPGHQLWTDRLLPHFLGTISGTTLAAVPLYFMIIGLKSAAQHHREVHLQDLRTSELEARLARAELEALRTQLQPHFLFNALHGISGLMGKDVGTARRMIAVLSELLRASLDPSPQQTVPLEEELAVLDRYLQLQKMRFGDRLLVSYHIDPALRRVPVPRLVLQPLVENSLEHGLSRRVQPGQVTIIAQRKDEAMRLAVIDDGDGLPPGTTQVEQRGIGLGHTQARLRQLYGSEQTLHFRPVPGGGFSVEITIPLSNGEKDDQDE